MPGNQERESRLTDNNQGLFYTVPLHKKVNAKTAAIFCKNALPILSSSLILIS